MRDVTLVRVLLQVRVASECEEVGAGGGETQIVERRLTTVEQLDVDASHFAQEHRLGKVAEVNLIEDGIS